MDADIGDISRALEQVKLSMSRKYTKEEIARIAKRKGMDVADFSREVIKKGI